MRAVYIPPAITNQVTRAEIHSHLGGGSDDHSGLRLAATARLSVLFTCVVTNFDSVNTRDCGS
jgi:hypothetical protein